MHSQASDLFRIVGLVDDRRGDRLGPGRLRVLPSRPHRTVIRRSARSANNDDQQNRSDADSPPLTSR